MVYSPMGMVPGGFSGLAILLSHMLYEYAGIPMAVWSINLLLNVPVFVWGIFEKGHRFIMKSFIANLIFSAMLYAIPEQPVAEGDFVMAAIVGGVLTGAGIGLVFATGYSTGGTDLLGSLICTYYPHISVANALFVIDSVIIVAGAFYFGVDKRLCNSSRFCFFEGNGRDPVRHDTKQTDLSYFKEMAGYSGGDHDIVKSRSDTDQSKGSV